MEDHRFERVNTISNLCGRQSKNKTMITSQNPEVISKM
jgi:hypothetical protein